jgi:hypothetical protein
MVSIKRTCSALLFASSLAAPIIGHAQTFKVEKHDTKGDGGTDYVAVEADTGRVFVSRATHMMVVEGATGTNSRFMRSSPTNRRTFLPPRAAIRVAG